MGASISQAPVSRRSPETDNGIALWTSQLETTNRWLVVRTPTI